ncbi:glutathione peroxidase [soil metagenome]
MSEKIRRATIFVCVMAAASALNAASSQSETRTPASTPSAAPQSTQANAACPAILNHRFNRLQDDAQQDLCQYAGKVVLVVNTASFCGFTKQYEGLEALQEKYKARGLVVLGFPSNDFGKQEPGSNKEIADFCFNTYGVKFPMFAKSSVSGAQVNPLHAELIKASGTTPKWNFYKYLIDRKGTVVASYSSLTEPGDKSLRSELEKALGH